jgi:hypothetical protein
MEQSTASTEQQSELPSEPEPEPDSSIPLGRCFKHLVLGSPRSLQDPKVFHRISLIAILAWVGLGADGLSSSAYGPEEAFKALGEHMYLAIGMAVATTLTVVIIAYAYSRVIEHFPFGGGGYIAQTEASLRDYADLTRRLGYAADWRMGIGTEVISEAETLCRDMAKEFPNSVFFASKLVFEREKWYQRLLHNETAAQLQRRLQFDGLTVIVLPVRVIEQKKFEAQLATG